MTTRIKDVIQPEVFTDYVIQRTMEKSELIQSGIVVNDPYYDELASTPNLIINMPYWEDLTGESEIMTDEGNLTIKKITSNQDKARKHGRANAWGANGLSAYLSGDDPMGAIGELVAEYWNRDRQRILLATLDGVFKSASMKSKVFDITDETGDNALITGDSFIDAGQLMGDAKSSITGVMMHSAVEAHLAKLDLIEYVQVSEQSDRIPFFMQKRVIVDDAMPYDAKTGNATVYLFGDGAIALGNGTHPSIVPTEIDRNPLSASGEDFLINRNVFIMHPRGIAWTEKSVTDVFPTNNEIATGTNWERVFEPKAVRIVKFNCSIKPNSTGETGETGETSE